MQRTILVVDDISTNRKILERALRSAGYAVRQATSGSHAIELIQESAPDLILLDIGMPDLDGYAVCETIKQDETLKDIPIIFISALEATFDKVKAFDVGGVDYITKPFQLEEMLARVRTHLLIRQLQQERDAIIDELREALAEVRRLEGLIPICAGCKQIRDDRGFWNSVESYISEHSDAEFSHGVCPECLERLYPEIHREMLKDSR